MNRRQFLQDCRCGLAASAALCWFKVDFALANDTETENPKPAADSWPRIKAKLLFVMRDWSQHDGQQLANAIHEALQGDKLPNKQTAAKDESELLSVVSFVPNAGQAAVFHLREFESLQQWLLEKELLVAEKTIPLKPTRFDGRLTATIDPDPDDRISTEQSWNLQIDLMRSSDEAISAQVSVKRSHSRRSPPGGPQLRGAAVDIRKPFSFFLPRDRAVLMTWYAHPEDAGRSPSPDQRTIEPVLVFEEDKEAESESKSDSERKAEFIFPERLIELMVD